MDHSELQHLSAIDMSQHVNNVIEKLMKDKKEITLPNLVREAKEYAQKQGISNDRWLSMVSRCVHVMHLINEEIKRAKKTELRYVFCGKDRAGNQE